MADQQVKHNTLHAVCTENVATNHGWSFHVCRKPAKWVVKTKDHLGNVEGAPRCGLHAKLSPFRPHVTREPLNNVKRRRA